MNKNQLQRAMAAKKRQPQRRAAEPRRAHRLGCRWLRSASDAEHFGLTERVHDDEHRSMIGSGDVLDPVGAPGGAATGRRTPGDEPFRLPGRDPRTRASPRASASGRAGVTETEWQDGKGFVRVPGGRPRRLPRGAVRVLTLRRPAQRLALGPRQPGHDEVVGVLDHLGHHPVGSEPSSATVFQWRLLRW